MKPVSTKCQNVTGNYSKSERQTDIAKNNMHRIICSRDIKIHVYQKVMECSGYKSVVVYIKDFFQAVLQITVIFPINSLFSMKLSGDNFTVLSNFNPASSFPWSRMLTDSVSNVRNVKK